MSLSLSLVIPCYNEAANIPPLLQRCGRLLELIGSGEIVLVENGSDDGSSEVMARLLPAYPGCRSVRVPSNRGYGFGILTGLAAATGTILGWTHGDLQTDPLDAARGLALFTATEKPEKLFVKGHRLGRPLKDAVLAAGMSAFETMLMGHSLVDITAQPTMFHRSFAEGWRDPPHDWSLDLFAYHTAKQNGLAVKRFPVVFAPRAHGGSHWNGGHRAKADFIRRTIRYSFRLRRTGVGL